MTIENESAPQMTIARFFDNRTPIFYYPDRKNLTLPNNLQPGTLVKVEWPERIGGFAHYIVKEPPKKDEEGVYLHALTPKELENLQKENPNPPTYQVNLLYHIVGEVRS